MSKNVSWKRDNFDRAELNPNESDENRPGQGI